MGVFTTKFAKFWLQIIHKVVLQKIAIFSKNMIHCERVILDLCIIGFGSLQVFFSTGIVKLSTCVVCLLCVNFTIIYLFLHNNMSMGMNAAWCGVACGKIPYKEKLFFLTFPSSKKARVKKGIHYY